MTKDALGGGMNVGHTHRLTVGLEDSHDDSLDFVLSDLPASRGISAATTLGRAAV
jgi:hypothetical protein